MRELEIVDWSRGCGKTTALVAAAKKIGATVVCADQRHAGHVSREHDVPTISAGQLERWIGKGTPLLWDHHAIDSVRLRASQRIAELRAEVDRLRAELGAREEHADNCPKCGDCSMGGIGVPPSDR